MKSNRLRSILGIAAALVLLATAGIWIATGAHRGWSQTQITEMQRDEVTGIDYPETRDGFVAGVDFVAVGLAIAALLAGASLLVGRRTRAP